MHIPDGFINAGTSLGAAAAAATGLGVAVRKTSAYLEDRQVPLAGLVAAYVFAVQMLNFPVVGGTSGHLLGGVLAAVLVGPWAGAICVAVVLLVQALFADGGITALGLNVLNMAIVGCFGGYLMFALFRRILPRTTGGVTLSAGVAAGLSVVAAAAAFTIEYAIGGAGGAPIGTVAAAVVGVHTLIGVGEALITGATVGMVLKVRPDLVYGAHGLLDAPLLRRQLQTEGAGS
ncbi:MAG TPA: energy-coupling factor ABC transporter permease [Actinomycetota bacterium]|nr:energy-coupling factor ABC transporter permease [Actinomycetota bacterium]